MDRYYKILGLPHNATYKEIKEAYYTKIKALHPDKVHGTSLEDTATFFTAENNEAYEMLMSQFNSDNSSKNNTTYSEVDIFIEGKGQLKYSLSNDFNQIITAIKNRSGINNVNTDSLEWTQNTGLSENVKNVMNKNNIEYSMTMFSEGHDLKIIINRRLDNQWYFVYFDIKSNCFSKTSFAYYEEEIFIESLNTLLKYSLSNNLDYIRYAIYERTGYNIKLENVVPVINPHLSPKVKKLMKKYNIEFSMTTYIIKGCLQITINRMVGDQCFIAQFTEVDGKLYSNKSLNEYEINKRRAYDQYYSDIDKMNTEIEASSMRADATLSILGSIWNLIKDVGKIG